MIVWIGYLASAFLAWSLIEKNSIKFRWLNIAGCISFIVYGIFITAFPVLLANTVLLGINIYQLVKLYNYKEDFQLVDVKCGDELVHKFINFYQKDILNYFPDFSFTSDTDRISFVVLRDLAIANLFVAKLDVAGNAMVEVNYTVPNYRDFKVGKFIFERGKSHLIAKGVKQIVYNNKVSKGHLDFIKVMGFEQQNDSYVKQL